MFKSLVIISLAFYYNNGLESPIIGLLSQESHIVSRYFPLEHHDTFIVASYVKYLESAGARVVPIWIGQSQKYYERVVNYTNGILFPGGGTYFNETDGYGDAARRIYQLVLDVNDKGIYYPIWGSCLGMQVLPFAALNGTDIRVQCYLRNKAVPLKFVKGLNTSKLFSRAPKKIINILQSENVTFNNHRYCLNKKVLKDHRISSDWRVLSVNNDTNGEEFISAMESKHYPIYGVQFHPEKNQFEFQGSGIPHKPDAIQVSQYFANFFVNECRKNNNTFPSNSMIGESLIYNYNPRYTGKNKHSSYEQIYVFNKTDTRKIQFI